MAMLRVCGHPGCETLTLGELCIEHEPPVRLPGRPRARVRVLAAGTGRAGASRTQPVRETETSSAQDTR